ncbi:MAG: hypothetical protein CM1200mP41_32550 [Gammaproteobacteria bacterium]|nr:MAG: hypothetical protein CM1200mP41_32550 [Gammaproteobacteria bacterium]
MLAGREDDSALVHDEWGDNLFLTTEFEQDISPIVARARLRSHARFEPPANR